MNNIVSQNMPRWQHSTRLHGHFTTRYARKINADTSKSLINEHLNVIFVVLEEFRKRLFKISFFTLQANTFFTHVIRTSSLSTRHLNHAFHAAIHSFAVTIPVS